MGLDTGAPQSIYRLNTADMKEIGIESLRPGQTWTLPDGSGSITFVDFTRWASFQVAYDPGKEVALVGAVLAITGLLLSLFIRRRRVWVRAVAGVPLAEDQAGSGQTMVQLAGLARIESADLPGELQMIRDAIVGGPGETSAQNNGNPKEPM